MYKSLVIIIIILFCVNLGKLSAQQLNIEYNHFIGADSCPTRPSNAVAVDNSVVIVGRTSCSGKGDIPVNTATGGGAIYVLKVDEQHNIKWAKVYGGSDEDDGHDIINTVDNRFTILAVSHSADGDIPQNYGNSDIVLLKLDSNGDKIWSKSYGSPAQDIPVSVIQTSDNGYLILGTSNGYGNDIPFHYTNSSFVKDWFLIKVDSVGNKEWCKVYGGTGNEESQGAILEVGGYFYLVASSESTDHDCTDTSWHSPQIYTKTDFYVIKIDTLGSIIWSKSYGGSEDDIAKTAIWDDRDNTIILYGYTNSDDYMVKGFHKDPDFPFITDDAFIVKIDTSGNLLWTKALGSYKNERGSKGIIKGPYGGYIVNSYATKQIGGQDDWIFILDNQGEVITDKVLGGQNHEFPQTILPYGNKYVAIGSTISDRFIEGFNTPIGYSSHIYLSTFHYFPASINNYKTNEEERMIAYPNPTSDHLTVEFIFRDSENINNSTLEVRNVHGKKMLTQHITDLQTPLKINTSLLSQGIYFLIWKRPGKPDISRTIINN